MQILFDILPEKETKGAFRYKEDAGSGPELIGSLYVRKSAYPQGAPAKIQVTIDPA